MAVVGVVVAAWAALGIPADATRNARTTADEPQYLLTALSLAEDGDLDISDEIRERRFEPFHRITIDPQTEVQADGSEVSPHDPLLPVLLAPGMAVGGWVGAKATLALLAGVLAASLVWVAVRRFAVDPVPAGVVTAAFCLGAPLVTYGSQVYPELPAALALTWGIGLVTGALARRDLLAVVLVVSALPWLGVKYAPVAAALVIVVALRLGRAGRVPTVWALVSGLAVSGVVFLVAHRVLYGGWTVYATGDHFTSTGELSVVGTDPDYLGRSRRVTGLLVDAHFGLIAWAPVYLLAVAALGAFLRRRPRGWLALVLPLGAGWATATWMALTMHGWWFPGRQVVVALPVLVLVTAWWAGRQQWVAAAAAGLGAVGVVLWAWTLADVVRTARTLIVDVASPVGPVASAWRAMLPDGLRGGSRDDTLLAVWSLVLTAAAAAGWWSADRVREPPVGSGDGDPGSRTRARSGPSTRQRLPSTTR